MEHSLSFCQAFFQKRQVISVLSVVMILLTLGVSVTFMRLHQTYAANPVNWSGDTMIGQKSLRSPSMVVFQGKLYVAYVAPDPNNLGKVYVTSSSDGITWPIDGTYTSLSVEMAGNGDQYMSPALAVFNNRLYMVYVPDESYQMMITSSSDGSTWSKGFPVPNDSTRDTPALAVYNNRLYVAFVDMHFHGSRDTILMIDSFDGTNWSGSSQVSNASVAQYSRTAPALAVYSGHLYIAFVSANSSNDVLFASYDGTSWSNDINTGQVTQAGAAITLTVFNDSLYMAFPDNGKNDHLLYMSGVGTSIWVPDQYTHLAAAMAVLNGKLYIAYIANNRSNDLLIVSGSATSASS
jgi:hypothetical protein